MSWCKVVLDRTCLDLGISVEIV